MGLPQGRTNNVAGRPKGSENKIKRELREVLTAFIEDKIAHIDIFFEELTSREKVRLISEILPYCIPKLNNMDLKEIDQSKNRGQSLIAKINEALIVNKSFDQNSPCQ